MSNTKQAKCVTPASSETLLHLLETLPSAFFFIDDTGTILYANASAQAMLGAPPEACCGNNFWRSAHQLVSTELYQAVRKTKQTRTLTEVEYVSPVTQNWLHVHLAPTVGGLTLQFHELREPARHPELFPQVERRLSIDDLDGLHTRIGILTPEGIVLDVNAVPLDDAQVRREEVIGKPLAETPWWSSSPASQEQLRAAIARASMGETVRFEALLHPREGMFLHVESVITPHMDADHHIEYLVIAGIDIAERKRAGEEIHALIDAIPQLVWTGRPDGYIDFYNQRWRDYTGMSTEEAQGKGWMQCTHPEDRQRVLQTWQRAVQTGRPYEAEQRLRNGTTGEYRWFLMQATPYTDAQGTILKYVGTCTDIHDKKQAEDELHVLVDAIPQFVWIMRPDGSAEYANPRWCDYTGMTSQQYQGDGWLQAIHHDDQQRVLAEWQSAVQAGRLYEAEQRLRNGTTGEYRWFLARGAPFKDAQGTILKYVGTTTDIDEQKQAEQRIKSSEENWRILAETVPQLVWTTQPDGRLDYCNQRYYELTQADFEQLRDYGWRQFLHPEDAERALTLRHHSLATGELFENEHRLRDGRTGTYRWFLARAMPVRNEAGQIVKWFGTCTDIHDKKRTEEELRVLIDAIPQFVWILRPDGFSEYGNQRWCDYTGMSRAQYQGDGWLQAIHPDDYEHTLTLWHHARVSGEPFEIEYRLKEDKTGGYRWFLGRAIPVRDEGGQIIKWFGTCTDIDEQKRIEDALRQSQERVNVLMNSSIIGINIIEGEQIVDANGTFLRMTGYTREDLREGRMNWLQMTPPEYLARTLETHEALAAQQPITYEKEYVCKDGSRLPVLVCGVILEQHPLQAIAFVLDNSARKELEQRKDAFISMASHELRNPLTALKLQTTLLHRQLARQGIPASAPALSSMEAQINKLIRLVEELLDVSKIQAGRLEYVQEPVDLDAVLREIADTMQHTHPSHRILMRGTVGASLLADRDRLGQVFTNLLSNAIKYSPGAETVEMDLSASAETVTIRVHDHGLGIPREQRDKIFERFYRAAGPQQRAIPGLGMGLYIVAEIVKGHGGTITVDSAVGKGSTFTVTLPKRRDA